MKLKSRIVRIAAAVAAVAFAHSAQARDLIWDSDGPSGVLGQDGSGGWDTTSSNWVNGDLITGTDVTWSNSPADSAIFGNTTSPYDSSVTNNVDVAEAIQVQNMTFGVGTNGGTYNISDFNAGSLTINGNIDKTAGNGQVKFTFVSGPIGISAGNHTFTLKDSPGDVAEMQMNGEVTGAGDITLDNGVGGYETWGTLAFNVNNSYTGVTNITNGRLVVTTSGGLGGAAAGTVIGPLGTLSMGGAGTSVGTGFTINEPITIQRDTYSGGEFGRYGAAVIFENTGTSQINTMTGPIVIDSADARIAVNSNTLILPGGNISLGPNGANGVLSFTGDYAGFVQMNGSNPALATNGIKLVDHVEVKISSQAAIGGPSSPITFAGDATLQPSPDMPNFGTHVVNYGSFNGGIDVPAGQTFTLDHAITGGAGIGQRGAGTLNINSPVNGNGFIFWDGVTIGGAANGIINVNAAVTLGSLHLRSPIVNIGTGGSITATGGYNSFGADSGGTNGTPDIAVMNLTGTGQFIQTSGDDFNISDNANTQGTVNVHDNAVFTTGGITWLGKNSGAIGRINQDGGTVNINRNGNFGLVLGDGRGSAGPQGFYNLSGTGILNSAGEFYVGEGNNGGPGVGTFNMSGNSAVNLSNWFVVAREGGFGTVDISGGTFTQTGGNFSIGESGSNNTLAIRGTAVVSSSGEAWFANGGGNKAAVTIADTAQFTNNNWFVVGRGGAFGTLDISGHAVVTKNGGGNAFVGESTNAVTSTITVRDFGNFTVNSGEFWVGQGGGIGILNVQDNAQVNVLSNWFALGRADGNSKGTVNLSGSASITKAGGGFLAIGSGGQGTFNQTGGTLTSRGTALGEASNGTYNISAGTATFTGEFTIGYGNNAQGTLNISNTANVTVPSVLFGHDSGGSGSGGTINLDGGTLTGNDFSAGAGGGPKVFNFNGGTLKAGVDTASFLGGLTTAAVQAGGAIIDSNGHTVTIDQVISGSGAAGVSKIGAGTVTFNGVNTYTSPTHVQQGTLALAKSWAPANNINLSPNTTLALAPIGTQQVVLTVTPSTVNIGTGAHVDLVDNKMVFQSTTYGAVKSLIDTGRNGGNWDGPGYITSLTLAKAASQVTTLAVADNALAGKTTFGGTSVSPSDILVMYTYNGDADLNGKVNADDYFIIDSNYNKGPTSAGFIKGDFNGDGQINGDDYFLIDTGFTGQSAALGQAPVVGGAALGGVSAVPEPSMLGILSLAAVGAMRRRRRQS